MSKGNYKKPRRKKGMPKKLKKRYNKVKALNERIAEIARKFGTNSRAYKDFEKALNLILPDQVGRSRKGYVRIKQGRKDIEKIKMKDLHLIEKSTTTAGKIKEKVKEEMQREFDYTPSDADIQDYIREKDDLQDFIDSGELGQILSEGGAKGKKLGRKLTWDEIQTLYQTYQAQLYMTEKDKKATIENFVNEHYHDNDYDFRSETMLDSDETWNELFGDEME